MTVISNALVFCFLVTLVRSSAIYQPSTSQEFDDYVKSGRVVVNFYATWCPNSQRMEPIFENLAQKYTNVRFLKVNGELNDDFRKLRRNAGVYGYPSFFAYNNGKIVKKQVGADEVYLEKLVKEYNGKKNVIKEDLNKFQQFTGADQITQRVPTQSETTQSQTIVTQPDVSIAYERLTTNKNSPTTLEIQSQILFVEDSSLNKDEELVFDYKNRIGND